MATSDLDLSYSDYLAVARRALNAAGTDAELDVIIQSGLRLFYFNTPGDPPHLWSFLQHYKDYVFGGPGAGGTETSVPLDDDFAGVVGRPTIRLPDGLRKLEVVPFEAIESAKTFDQEGTPHLPNVGTPRYIAFQRFGNSNGSDSWRAFVWPRDLANAHTIQIVYKIAPTKITPDAGAQYPSGGTPYAETLKAAIGAAAEIYEMDARGPKWELFQELAAEAVKYDMQFAPATSAGGVWPTLGESDTLDQTFVDIALQIGGGLKYGANPNGWSEYQLADVKSVFNQGYRRFLSAEQWKFQFPLDRMTVNADSNVYDLKSDFGLVLFDFTYVADDHLAL